MWQIRRRSQLEISSGTDRPTTIRIVVGESFDDIDDRSPPLEVGPLAALSRKLSSRRSRRQQDCGTTTPPPTAGAPEVNTGSRMFGGEAPSTNVGLRAAQSKMFSRRNFAGTCRSETLLDRDDISICTFTNMDAISAGATGSRPIDNSEDALLATPTSCRDDNGEVRVHFRFDSVSRTGADQKDVTSTCPLPKEPHPVRDQTVHRRSSPMEDASRADNKSVYSTRQSCPPTAARRLSQNVDEDPGDVDAPRQWPLRRRAPGGRRGRPSSALRKEIKAARQLGVIMGAFTLCFLW